MNEDNYNSSSILIDPEWSHAYKSIIDQTFEIPFYICSNGIHISNKGKRASWKQKWNAGFYWVYFHLCQSWMTGYLKVWIYVLYSCLVFKDVSSNSEWIAKDQV